MDLAASQSAAKGAWTTSALSALPPTTATSLATYDVGPGALANRDQGRISSTLVGSYAFLQFDGISPADVESRIDTFRAFFIRSALMSFVDYGSNRVLGWDQQAIEIPLDVAGVISACNKHGVAVFLEINYSDYVPGATGSGVGSLVKTDNVARTIAYLSGLAAAGLHVDGVTFGDEWGDDSGWGTAKPTLLNSDMVARFVAYATALKQHFPALRIWAFDSYVGAARGEIGQYWDALTRIRAAEVAAGVTLLDGFAFRESYVYIDSSGKLEPSQIILDDTESLASSAPVYRYDTRGDSTGNPDRDYLHAILVRTQAIFGRRIDIALTEYLPAGPVQISESDTSRYADIDFVVHYADVVGTYAALGLDSVSTFAFANSPQQAKSYVDRFGHEGAAYPVHQQLAEDLAGTMLAVSGSADYSTVRVKVYAARSSKGTFVMLLNKNAGKAQTVRLFVAGDLDLTVTLPARSYTSLLIDAAGVTVSSIGG